MKAKKSVLFVCGANMFRSVVGEKLLKKHLKKKMKVSSCGIEGKYKGKKTNPTVLKVTARFGMDLKRHRGKLLTKKRVEEADLILVFDNHIKGFIEKKYPDSKKKIFLVKRFAGLKKDAEFHDLAGASEEAHENFIKEIKPIIRKISKKVS